MAAVGDSAPDDEPGVNAKDQSVKENRPNVANDAENEPAMLDEEEMPSFVSLNSLPIPEDAKPEEKVVKESEEAEPARERASSPYTSEHGADSVCVLSSGEESDRRPYEGMDDYDSEEMDMEEEEEDEEEDDSCGNEDEEESEGDIETEQFERSSDDFVLRYDSGLERHHKERSRSLQDLTNSRGNLSRFVGKRRSIDLMGSNEPDFARNNLQGLEDPLLLRKKVPRSVKYDHVPSKVKLYIQEMKEQRRRSAERLNRETPQQRNSIELVKTCGENVDTRSRQNSSRTLKSYVQNAINEIKVNDLGGVDETYNDNRTSQDRAEFPGIHKIHDIKEMDETDKIPDSIPQNLTRTSENTPKKFKSNGLVDYADNERARESAKIGESNGPREIPAIFNVRSLNYEEYTNGVETSKDIVENLSVAKLGRNNEASEYTEQLFVSELQIEAPGKGDEITSKARPVDASESRETWNLRELTFDEPRRKIAQVDCEVYQKTIDDNISMRRDLEEMRKMFEQYRCDNPPVEEYEKVVAENTILKKKLADIVKEFDAFKAANVPAEKKVAAVQTDLGNDEKTDTTIEQSRQESLTNKILSSTVTSALSSIEVWSDSNCSPAISIDPPNIEAALNSDDSLAAGERPAPKTPRQLSHSFVTSSRILQTLASITQGRSRTAKESPGNVKRNDSRSHVEQGQSKRPMLDSILAGSEDVDSPRAKKRKASDMLGVPSNAPEPFKIPYTPGDARRKISSDSAADGARKPDQRSRINDNSDKLHDRDAERPADPREDDDDNDAPKNVKYFVYHDEPDSKERSFLIQADDSGKNEETLDRGGHVRECGPFLLGNVEIRMTETNGTINIWGKEINQSTDDAEVDVEMEDSEVNDRSFVPRSSFVCQSTPHHKCQSVDASACSSHKRARLSPKFGRSGIGKYLRSAATSMSRSNSFNNTNNFEACTATPIPDNNRTVNCEHCESHEKRSRVSSCEDNNINSRVKQQRGCCIKNIEINERDCDCTAEKEIFDDSAIYENMSNILAKHEKCTDSLNNALSKHVCVNYFNEDIANNQTSHCRHSLGHDDDLHRTKKRASCFNDLPSCSARLTTRSHSCHENTSHSHNHFSWDDDEHPLISPEREHCETLQTKRRRLSGKKVRGILTDLLRGCGGGGCRDQNSTSSLPRPNLSNVIPKIQLTPCSPLQSSSSKRPNSHSCHLNHLSNETITDNRCCNSCTRRAEMRAQIENQLEIFQDVMEQLRTRSDSVLEMLHQLKAETD